MAIRPTSTRGKLLATGALLALAAGAAGLGTFGSFTSTTSASENAASGTVTIALGSGSDSTLNVDATNLVPGDTVQRVVKLTNSGSADLANVTLSTTATASSVLDTDATNGLQLSIDTCSKAWDQQGSSLVYKCNGTQQSVLGSTPVIGSNMALANLNSVTAGKSDYLRVTLSFPSSADNSFQGKSSTINFAFTGTQRAAGNR
ncbi:MAG TPA: TasA family protein [Jatrophihabitans sp.]|nr:TasA family protein [Jatrophihabitans sp.]